MATEKLYADYLSDYTAYAILWNSDEQVCVPGGSGFGGYSDSQWINYAIILPELGNSGHYATDLPAFITVNNLTGTYHYTVYLQQGITPDLTDIPYRIGGGTITVTDSTLISTISTNTLDGLAYLDHIEAQTYFDTRLNSKVWDSSTTDDQDKALITATRMIDRLSFIGSKTDNTGSQLLEFPRGDDESIPDDIKIACCEIAIALLDDKDIEEETDNINVESDVYDRVRSTYNRSFVQEHIRAGIPSIKAWGYLLPYLSANTKVIKLSRVS